MGIAHQDKEIKCHTPIITTNVSRLYNRFVGLEHCLFMWNAMIVRLPLEVQLRLSGSAL